MSILPKTLINLGRRYLWRHPGQTVLMIVGIMLGVAVVVAIDLANASASRAFDLSADAVAGRATHHIVGGPTGIEEEIYADLRRQGVPIPLAPVMVEYVAVPQLGNRPLQLLGIDPFVEAPFRSYLGGDSGSLTTELVTFFTTPGAVLISSDLAQRYGLEFTSPITIEVAGSVHSGIVAGIIDPPDSLSRRALEGILLTDIATVQELTGRSGKLDRIDLIVENDNNGTLDQIGKMLSSGVRIVETETRTGTIKEMTAAFRTNLTALSMLALVVGLFLIYNTMTFSVVQRRRLFGTLRALGVTRNEIFILIVGEALFAACFGTAAGLALGIVLGQGAVQLVSRTINDLFFVLTVRGVELPTSSLVKGALLGIFATVLAAAPPAWEAASVPPRAALSRANLEDKARVAVSRVALGGLLVIGLGIAILILPTNSLEVSFGGTFAIILGFAMLTPFGTKLLMGAFLPVTGKLWGALGRMAPRNVTKSLSRTAISVAALMIAVSVTIGVSVMVESFRTTVGVWLGQSLRGDIYISPPAVVGTQSTGLVDPGVFPILESWPGVRRVDTFRLVQAESTLGAVSLAHTQNPSIGVERVYQWVSMDPLDVWDAMLQGAVIVSEPFANRNQIPRRDASVTIYTPRGPKTFPVVGVYYDYTSTQGTILMAYSVYGEQWADDGVGAVSLRLDPGVNPDILATELADRLAAIQRLEVRPNAALRADALEIFDRTFAITGAMQILSTIVAFIGILSALLSLQLDKGRELGILRAIGLTSRELWRLVLLETGLMGAAAGLLALPSGLALALVLIYIINRRAFGWTLQFSADPIPFLNAFLIALLAALLAGIYPAYKIGKMVTAEAMRFE